MTINIDQIYKLRKKTGIGILDCKNALIKSNGHFEEAIIFLRKKGKKIYFKKSLDDIKHGAIISITNQNKNIGNIIGLSCETDALSTSREFIFFLKKIANISLCYNNKEFFLNKIKNLIYDQIAITSEKIELKIFEQIHSPCVLHYTHYYKIATLVGFLSTIKTEEYNKYTNDLKNIVLHITAMNPISINQNDFPKSLIKKELEIIKDQIKNENQSETIKNSMISGKIKKFIMNNTLINQKYIKNTKITIQEYLKNFKHIQINNYKRISIS
ncbi:translation elongation factor Ts [Blattabacterium cuenoti]|uniref:translation elongation factor Ts n=1 Tax=Blattabacterium cuenoti TaxID=1653831 RepID=UPI00163CC382|nr:translation elongation factor Ts [Blattabacterium cuenoti]